MRGITNYIDTAQVVLYAFWAFFALLIFYLRREDRREGYPLESETRGVSTSGHYLIPSAKTFLLAHGGVQTAPRAARDTRAVNAVKTAPWPGAPWTPTGDPMLANVGPGSYAERADVPDRNYHGENVIVPMRVATAFGVAPGDADPRGMEVVGADRGVAGVISDVWVDRSESLARYYEVALAGGGRSVMLPVTFSKVDSKRRRVHVKALLASQFANVPALKSPNEITILEEEKVAAYYGAGTLYATPLRVESRL